VTQVECVPCIGNIRTGFQWKFLKERNLIEDRHTDIAVMITWVLNKQGEISADWIHLKQDADHSLSCMNMLLIIMFRKTHGIHD
jgi:hypothetical protein